jgi:hypothetical protein
MDRIWNRYNLKSTRRIYKIGILKCSEKFTVLYLPQYISIKIKLNLNSGGAYPWHGNRKWVTLRRWGDVRAGGESCAPVLIDTTAAFGEHSSRMRFTSMFEIHQKW